MNRTSLIVERSRGFAHLSPLAGRGRIALVPTFRSSYTISAITFYELRKAMGTSKFRILVPLFDLKSLGSFRRLRCRDFKSAALAIRVRGNLSKRGDNSFKHACHVPQNIVIPEPQNSVFVIDQPFVTSNIQHAVSVLPSVGLNDKTTVTADKIDGVRADRLLPNKFIAAQFARPQLMPERYFCVGGSSAQTSRTLGLFFTSSSQVETPPHPAGFARRPLPARGERLALRRAARRGRGMSRDHRVLPSSWPGLSRPSTASWLSKNNTWMPGTSPGKTIESSPQASRTLGPFFVSSSPAQTPPHPAGLAADLCPHREGVPGVAE
jgi:hypothetical protein